MDPREEEHCILAPELKRILKYVGGMIKNSVKISAIANHFGITKNGIKWFADMYPNLSQEMKKSEGGTIRLVGYVMNDPDEEFEKPSLTSSEGITLQETPEVPKDRMKQLQEVQAKGALSDEDATIAELAIQLNVLEAKLERTTSLNRLLLKALTDGSCPICHNHAKLSASHIKTDQHKQALAKLTETGNVS